MRELKFRAWFPITKELIVFCDPYICSEYSTISFETEKEDYKGICMLPDDYTEVKMNVLMQFTGLLDKNGKEIYEFDKLKDLGGDIGIVEFDDGSFIIKHENGTSNFIARVNHFEIVGNIYEN